MKKVISVNSPADVTIEKLNEAVRTKVEIKDKLGLTEYYFWGEKIVQNTFLWDSARHVNNLLRVRGEIIDKDAEHSEVHIKAINRLPYYFIYVLAIWFILIALLSSKIFFAFFAVVFIVFSWIMKSKYIDDIIADINSIVGVHEE